MSNDRAILVYKDIGLVSQVFDRKSLSTLNGHVSVGRVRYATTGTSTWESAQPILGPTHSSSSSAGPASGNVHSGTVVLAHDENLTGTAELMGEV